MRLATLVLLVGCGSSSYEVSRSELMRLAALAPEQRTVLRVDQTITDPAVQGAERITSDTVIVPRGEIEVGGGGGHSGPSIGHIGHGGGHGGGPSFGGGGGDGKGLAIVIVVVAVCALIIATAIEASRFDGTAQVHPMMPVHLMGKDGNYDTVPLAWLDPGMAATADHAIIRDDEGPFRVIDRAPLWRTGWNYNFFTGRSTMRSVWGDLADGQAFTIQLGYWPTQQVGIVGSIFFGWRDNREHYTMFDSRYTVELQAMPVELGIFHAGGYVGYGGASRFEGSDFKANGNDSGSAYTAGAMLQLALHTRIALTARLGAAEAHGEHSTEAMLGLSVY